MNDTKGCARRVATGLSSLRDRAAARLAALRFNPSRCSTCGTDDPDANWYCSNGFHAEGPTYWPGEVTPEIDHALRAALRDSTEYLGPIE